MKVLFVEDDYSIAMGLEYSLKQEGYDVRTCHSAAEAFRALEEEAFDICRKKIAEHELDMNLVSVECTFDLNKILFYFTVHLTGCSSERGWPIFYQTGAASQAKA